MCRRIEQRGELHPRFGYRVINIRIVHSHSHGVLEQLVYNDSHRRYRERIRNPDADHILRHCPHAVT
jgi:hypothetical protein